jgi:hypothetical protein
METKARVTDDNCFVSAYAFSRKSRRESMEYAEGIKLATHLSSAEYKTRLEEASEANRIEHSKEQDVANENNVAVDLLHWCGC